MTALKKDNIKGIVDMEKGIENLIMLDNSLITKEVNLSLDKLNWYDINWKKANEKVNKIQEKIVIATRENYMKLMYNLQRKFVCKFFGRALAARKVILNKGGKTPGIEGIVWNSSNDYWKAVNKLNNPIEKIISDLHPILRG